MATRCTIVVVATILGIGCHKPAPPAIPGHTEVHVSAVTIAARPGAQSEVDYKPLLENLGLRAKTAIRPERTFNPFRMVEDRRRIAAYLQGLGRFDAEVDEPDLAYTPDGKSVAVTWHVHEGAAYTIASVEIVGVPAEHAATLRALVPFGAGDRIDLDTYRPLRRALAERLQDEGYGHARGYSRMFVDRDAKTVAWFYYIDPGPQTRIGTLRVEGNHKVPVDAILERAGLAPGHSYSTAEKRRAELALLDSGAFASATVLSDADIQTGPPEHPDTGGALAAEQVDADGKLVPRPLSNDLAVRVVVVEAPQRQLRAELGLEADPTRVDAYIGARVLLRNGFGPQHHVALEGNVGYGWLVRDGDPAKGVYGSAIAQYLKPGFIHRALDARITMRWRDTLYPDALLREVVAGPGVRSTIAPGVFFDVDAFYRFGRQIGMPAVDAMSELALPATSESRGGELVASVIADRRNDRVEPTDGWLLGVRGSYSPGGPIADHRWLQLVGDARGFVPLGKAWSLGARATAGAVTLAGADGVPLGPRLFGGGAYGMRGFGRDHLSPAACASAVTTMCEPVLVGGRSLVESSLELRYLPFRRLSGAAAFVDAGAAGAALNPFATGVSAAVGLGGRLRTWYLPIAIDVSYRLVEENQVAAELDRLLVFFRIGEAF